MDQFTKRELALIAATLQYYQGNRDNTDFPRSLLNIETNQGEWGQLIDEDINNLVGMIRREIQEVRLWIVIDNNFNQKWYQDLIGKTYAQENIPSYVNVKEIK